jgi:hypothetical protein
MYVVGDSTDVGGFDSKLMCFDMSTGLPVLLWAAELPEHIPGIGPADITALNNTLGILPGELHRYNPSVGGGDVERNPAAVGLEVAGNYVFLGIHSPASVHVYRASDGAEVTFLGNTGNMETLRFNPGPELSGLFTDLDNGNAGMNAHYVTSTGEYVIFTNDDMFGKARMYRWIPSDLNYEAYNETFEVTENYSNLARLSANAPVPSAPAGHSKGGWVGRINIPLSTATATSSITATSAVNIPLPDGAAGVEIESLVGLSAPENGDIRFKVALTFKDKDGIVTGNVTTSSAVGNTWHTTMNAYAKSPLSIPANSTTISEVKITFEQNAFSKPAQVGYVDNVTIGVLYE